MVYLIALLLLPTTAYAAPIGAAIAAWYAAATAVAVAMVAVQIAMVAYSVYGAANARKKAKRDARRARDEYNASLTDRMITQVAADVSHVYVYGEAKVGSAIVAMFTSGDKDQYKHLVCVHAAHECESIDDVYVAGKALGALDGSGWVTTGDYANVTTESATEYHAADTFTLLYEPKLGISCWARSRVGQPYNRPVPYIRDGRNVTVTGDHYGSVRVTYQYSKTTPRVNVKKHLGTPTDTVDVYLNGLFPDKWPATSVLRGFCYTGITLDLNQAEFQGGIPSVEVKMKGKKLYDPRTGTTYWSQNNALATYDYLTSELCGVDPADLPLAQFITAANVCDEAQSFGARYTFNGTVTSDQDQAGVLETMAQSMAGGIVSTTWDIYAGKYIAPVMALDQTDIVGSIAITPGMSDGDLYNGVKGQYISDENSYVAMDIKPYQNAAYVTADGKELWTNIDFPFTDKLQRCHNLARNFTEDQRNGYTVKAEFSQKAWKLKVGNRVTLTSSFFEWNAKVFRVTDKAYSPKSAVELTLKEDAASIWDFADAVTVDATPNTNLVSPFAITKPASLTCESGTDHLLMMQDGTIVSRIYVRWPAVSADEVQIEWSTDGAWQKYSAPADAMQAYLSPVLDGEFYTVRARSVNLYVNVKSDWTYATPHQVIGKSDPPPDVSAFSITNGVLSWPEISRDDVLDLAGYRIKFQYGRNTSWTNAAPVHAGLLTASPYLPELMPPGAITLMIRAVDTSGNESANSAVIYHNFGDAIVDNLILSYDDKGAGFPGDKTNCAVIGGDLLADDSGDLFWSGDTDPFWGMDSATFWPTATYKRMTYVTRYQVQPDESGSRLTLALAVAAASYNIEYRYDTQGEFWGNDAAYFWNDDLDMFWPAPTSWQTWPGAIDSISEALIEIRITTQAGIVRGALSALTMQFDVEDEYEEIDDVSILSTGTRLPLTKTYRSIKNIQLTLQDDGGTAGSAKWNDKLASGPLVYCFNNSGAKVAGVIDARIQGVKG